MIIANRSQAATWAASDSSYHGGSRRGGDGHALAADIVSVKGENSPQRNALSEELWKWIDAHAKELGIGRPYLERRPAACRTDRWEGVCRQARPERFAPAKS